MADRKSKTKNRKPKPDTQGRYRPYIGKQPTGKPKRWNLGRDAKRAERLAMQLRELVETTPDGIWTAELLAIADDLIEGRTPTVSPQLVWDEVAVETPPQMSPAAVEAFRQGTRRRETGYQPPRPMPAELTEAIPSPEHRPRLEGTADQMGERYGLNVAEADNGSRQMAQTYGDIHAAMLQQQIDSMADELASLKRQLAQTYRDTGRPEKADEAQPITGTWHDAIAAYIDSVVQQYGIKGPDGTMQPPKGGHRSNQIKFAKYITADTANMDLRRLDWAAIETMFRHYAGLPLSQSTGKRLSKSYAKHHIDTIKTICKWIGNQDRFSWTAPPQLYGERVTYAKDYGKAKRQARTRGQAIKTYGADQLQQIASQCSYRQAVQIGLALNLSAGAAELGRLEVADFKIREVHPTAEESGIESTAADSWVITARPKSLVYSEHLLWPELAELVGPYLDRAERIGLIGEGQSPLVFVSDAGEPMYQDNGSRRNPHQTLANRYEAARDEAIEINPDLPKLSFGKMRKTLSDRMTSEKHYIESKLQLAHGNPLASIDEMLSAYANHPYRQLHLLLREYRDDYRAVLQTLLGKLSAK